MFNLKRIYNFYCAFLADLIPLGLLIFVLAVLTELFTAAPRSLPGSLFTWEFWLAVILNVLPAILVTLVVFWLAGHFVRAVYNLNSWREGVGFLARSRLGQSGFGPFMIIAEGKIARNEDSILTRLGGPGHLIIRNDSAVVLERGGKLTRVLGPGFPKLEPFEKIYDIVDLRPKHWKYSVGAMTSEGIRIDWDVEVIYQIANGGQKPTKKEPYPFSPEDIFRAATSKWRREASRTQDMDWEGRLVIGDMEGILRSILAQRSLNQLIGLTEAEEAAAREVVQQELAEKLAKQIYPKLGARIIQVKLDNLRVKDEITQEWIKVWKAHWQSWSDIQWGEEQAQRICLYETAKAEAQARLIETITRALQGVDHRQPITPAIVLMRLFSALDRAHLPAAARVFVPNLAIEGLEKIDHLIAGQDGSERSPRPAPNSGGGNGPGDPRRSSPPPNQPRRPGPSRPHSATSASPKIIPLRRIPIISEIAAGKEAPVSDEDILGEIDWNGETFQFEQQLLQVDLLKGSRTKFSPEYDYYAVQVSGDSMDRAGIAPGDYVLLQKEMDLPIHPLSGDIVAVVFRDEADRRATLKRIRIQSGQVTLKPESSNPEHQLRTLPAGDFAGDDPAVAVRGIAVAVLKPTV